MNMIPYIKDSQGRAWYICRDCGNKEMRQYNFCPVCKNTARNTNPEYLSALARLIASGRH